MEESQIRNFFTNQTIFITGGSGFLGKVLIEKLLRTCDVKKIYVLMRSKKGKTSEQRFEDFFSYPCFDILKSQYPNSLRKLSLVIGDCQKSFLGLSDQDQYFLIRETTCVIHAAANVKFDQTLKEATGNVKATKDVLDMAKKMPNLKVFIYVSTAYSNCLHSHIKEEFYEPPMKAENLFSLVNALNDDLLQAITPQILGEWPNTYIFTKSITEDLVKTASNDLPITIIRPAIVTSAVAEPIPGWIDNFYGVCGIVFVAALGIIRSLHAKKDARAALVPVDYVSNCLLASAWHRSKHSTTTIHNYTGYNDDRLTWGKFMKMIEKDCWEAASEKVVWYYCFQLRENETWHKICVFLMHTIPAHIADFVLGCLGKPKIAVSNYQRLDKSFSLISYFSTRSWKFDNDNVLKLWESLNDEDKKLFCFDVEQIDVDQYTHNSVFGGRQFLLKDSLDTIPKGKRKLKIMFVAHYTLLGLLCFLLYKLIMFIFGLFW